MGTRNLTIVVVNGKYKVAQYGQWDGYPSGNGVICLEFARKLTNPDLRQKFEDALNRCSYITEQDITDINEQISNGTLKDWTLVYPELSRNTGAGILDLILNTDRDLKLQNKIEFAANSLFCEYAWLINLDDNTFEGYRGFNRDPLDKSERFCNMEGDGGYYPVKLAVKYPLENLPTKEEFLEEFEKSEEE